MLIEIPGRDSLNIDTILLDYNGTIAVDGKIPSYVAMQIKELSDHYTIYVLTADTYGHAKKECAPLPVTVKTFPAGEAASQKANIAKELGANNCAALGNGFNDIKMFNEVALSIGVIGREGFSGKLFSHCDIVSSSMEDALDLLLHPMRVIADLRW